MAAVKAGDMVVVDFPGITGVKRRPAVVVSTDAYHGHRPDVLLAAITTNLTAATTPMDYTLKEWAAAGLRRPSAFRTFGVTMPQAQVLSVIGHLADTDWEAIRDCLRRAVAI